MPKRKDYDERIKKYESKLQRLMEKQSRLSRSPSRPPTAECPEHIDSDSDEISMKSNYTDADKGSSYECDNDIAAFTPEALPEDQPEDQSGKVQEAPIEQNQEVDPADIALDAETLKALGKPSKEKLKYGPNINGDLAKLWNPILKNGLDDPKDKQMLFEKYLVPNNCQLLQAPKLNLEILATITDIIKNRDKRIEEDQQQLGHGITALNRALSLLATNTGDRALIINMLSEASQILSDLHYGLTLDRKKLITPILDKKFLELIKDVERSEYLYGGELSEKIKAMKTAQTSSKSIKKVDNFKVPFKKSRTVNSPGNSKGLPRYQGPKPYNRSGPKRPLDRPPATYNQTRKSKPESKPPARK